MTPTEERLVKLATWKSEGIKRFTVRVYDMFDGWCDCYDAINVSAEDAMQTWLKDTKNGIRNTKYADGDYYDIFPADTKMMCTPEYYGRE
jgi:hypothetical protein